MKPLDNDHVAVMLLNRSMAMVRGLRRHATARLANACAALGITPADMEDNDRAVVACLVLNKAPGKRSDRQAAVLLRWCIVAEEHGIDDRVAVRIQQALRGLDAAVQADQQRDQQGAAREASAATRRAQAEHDAALVGELFAAAWRQGHGRIGLQAAAAELLRQREHALQEQLITAQQVGNKRLQRQHSAGLQALQRQGVLCTLHRAGKWLQQRTGKP